MIKTTNRNSLLLPTFDAASGVPLAKHCGVFSIARVSACDTA
jgi:hypothetical protein